ncbi:catabolic L-serine/threonine dehydratase [Exophiala xenobiotica]|uniref:L-serine ammonia-lyase n=1 Tax=Lithohypha guttulata TaxID=1690604 RepID=A0ABR0K6G3_9EURO|nr:catabolic L-serine/threonine dehydratase [Lithohypha guttulata]KAK5315143.1 catabolic L-serine/threonine dehydratase [Exophiala xenobiotica]
MGSIAFPTPKTKPWIETPLVESSTLSKAAGCRIFLKLENLQPSGSFKSRGIGNLLLQAIRAQQSSSDDRPLHFHASSGGNAGLACVTAAVSLGYRSTIAVPSSTEESMVARLRAAGASEVIVHGSNWFVADRYLREVVMPKAEEMGEKAVYVPPFDHPDVWTGASTMVPEIRRQMPDGEAPDAIVCSVGGGGLFAGIMQGVEEEAWNTHVLAVETAGADSLAQAIEKRELVALDEITSVAKSLGAPIVAQRALDYALQPNVSNLVIEDAEACASGWRFADDERILVEPACGASVALAYDGRLRRYLKGFSEESKVVIVLCGGSRIDLKMMENYKRQFGARAKELGLTRCEDVPSTFTS